MKKTKKLSNAKLLKYRDKTLLDAVRKVLRPIHDYLTIHPQLLETRNGKILHDLCVFCYPEQKDHKLAFIAAHTLDVFCEYPLSDNTKEIEQYKDFVEALLKLDLERFANVLRIDKSFDFDNADFLYEHTYLRDLE